MTAIGLALPEPPHSGHGTGVRDTKGGGTPVPPRPPRPRAAQAALPAHCGGHRQATATVAPHLHQGKNPETAVRRRK